MNLQAQKSTVIYVGDPMCSWCYGFAPELETMMAEFEDDFQFEIILGGLRPYNTESMADLRDFLTDHWQEVHEKSGQPFSYDILNSNTISYDTEPPCRAAMIVRERFPDKAFEFFSLLQTAFYRDNLDLNQLENYEQAIKAIGWSYEEFAEIFQTQEAKENIKKDFHKASEMGVRGFPTVLISIDGQLEVISRGYTTSSTLRERMKFYLQK